MHGKYSVSVFPYRVLCDSRLKNNNKKLNKALKKFQKSLCMLWMWIRKSQNWSRELHVSALYLFPFVYISKDQKVVSWTIAQ